MSTLQCKPKLVAGTVASRATGVTSMHQSLGVRPLPYPGGLLQIGHLKACRLSLGEQEGRSPTATSEHTLGCWTPPRTARRRHDDSDLTDVKRFFVPV